MSYQSLYNEAVQNGISFIERFHHIFIHGVLHILGYNHELDSEAVVMEALESQIMIKLGYDDPHCVQNIL
jgi:probable rRNA maturation factor